VLFFCTSTATLSDIRSALKGYQSSIGESATGTLNQRILNRIMEERIELPPYTVPGGAPWI